MNPLGTFLSPIHVLPNCQISNNSDVQILIYRLTDEQTDGRTNVRETKKSENSYARIFRKMGERTEVNQKVHRLRRETKNQTITINQSEEKLRKPHSLAFLRGLEGIKN